MAGATLMTTMTGRPALYGIRRADCMWGWAAITRRQDALDQGRLRGKVMRIEADGPLVALGHEFRYPTGLAITDDDQVFVSDNQGLQNPFNEINHLVAVTDTGFPACSKSRTKGQCVPGNPGAAPWTRSVNGLFFQKRGPGGPFSGQGIGCEYDSRFLVRFSIEKIRRRIRGRSIRSVCHRERRCRESLPTRSRKAPPT